MFRVSVPFIVVAVAIQFVHPIAIAQNWELELASAWKLTFEPYSATLTCIHAAAHVSMNGRLEFRHVESTDKNEMWRVVPPRDSVANRLALLDTAGNVQGYVTFAATPTSLSIRVIHRTAQNYQGELWYSPVVTLHPRAFACRTKPPRNGQVVQMASGPANSRLNDSIFDIATDTALQFSAASLNIHACTSTFFVLMRAIPNEAEDAAIEINVLEHYYQSRYIPYYTPINKQRCPHAPTGWMSWNVYFDTAGEKENLDEARVAARCLKPFGMDIFSIESWQDNSPQLPVSDFHNLTLRPDPNKFPSGMKGLADQIRDLGFKPGIWTVPFGTGDKAFYEAHKAWFLHNPDGTPMSNWCGRYVLDPSQEEVRQQMEETHRIMSQEWGYEYFKIDGMSGRNEGYSAHFYERDNVRAAFKDPTVADPFKLCVEALRRGIGPDRLFLACQGHYTGPEIGLADAGRIGADIVGHRRPPDWNNYENQARATLNQLFVNDIVWYGDPDTLLVGTANPLETVRLAASVVALTGQAMFAGDKLGELPEERMRLLQQCLPVCDIRPLDLFPIFDMLPVWDLKINRPFGDWDVVSLFNWEGNTRDMSLNIEELGLDPGKSYLIYDCWNHRLSRSGDGALHCDVPGHGNALLTLHPDESRPQVVFSDRHLTQGGVDMESIFWDQSQRTLSGVIRLVENAPTTLAVTTPAGYTLSSTTGPIVETRAADDGTLLCTLQQPQSGSAEWTLKF